MSFKNPTPIQVGTWGTFNGARYRVAGRLVLGCDVDGERYYWNEFHLVGENGDEATLVHEVGDRGVEWRMFVMFAPEYALTAAEAARKRIGDRINLEGTDARITLVDESRVYYIEGDAPEGVELGDVANYFNARLGKDMIVVSWSGEEVEYYRGKDITGGLVATAFGLRAQDFNRLLSSSGGKASAFGASDFSSSSFSGEAEIWSKRVLQVLVIVVIGAIFFATKTSCRSHRRPAPIAKISAPASPLAYGSEGTFEGNTWRIRAHSVVEVSEVGRRFERHEYHLTDSNGNRALLVCGLNPRDTDWMWFTPLAPLEPLTPAQAGGLRLGDSVSVDGWVGPITGLFQAVNGPTNSDLFEVRGGTVKFGFTLQSGATMVLVRWDTAHITFHRGVKCSALEIKKAFGKS